MSRRRGIFLECVFSSMDLAPVMGYLLSTRVPSISMMKPAGCLFVFILL